MSGVSSTGGPRVRRPLVSGALFFTAGTVAGLQAPAFAPALLAFAAAFAALRFGRSSGRLAAVLTAAAWLAAGWGSASAPFREDDLSRRLPRGDSGRFLEVEGTVAYDPERFGADPNRPYWIFPLNADAVRTASGWRPVRGRLEVRWSAGFREREPRYGDRLTARGPARVHTRPWSGGMMPRAVVLDAEERDVEFLSRARGSSLLGWALAQRRRAADLLEAGLESTPDRSAFLQGLLLGLRDRMTPALRELFLATGTVHILAISGLHVGVFALLILGCSRAAGLSRQHMLLIMAPVLIAYTASTGLRPSAVRACAMALAYWLALPLRRRPDAPSSLAAAAIVILAWSPPQIASPGFQYSFLIVSAFLLILPALRARLPAGWQPDPWAPGGGSRTARLAARVGRSAWGLVAASTVAWIVSAPLTAYYSNRAAPIALVANLVLVPLSFVVVSLGVAAIVSGMIHPALAALVNRLNGWLVGGLIGFLDALSGLPFGHWIVESPPFWFALISTPLLMTALAFRGWKRRASAAGLALAAVLLAVHGGLHSVPALDWIDVGRGQCGIFQGPDGAVLIDGGHDVYANRVLRELRKRGIGRLSAILITRSGRSWCGAAEHVIAAGLGGHVIAAANLEATAAGRACRRAAERAGARTIVLRPGEAVAATPSLRVRSLAAGGRTGGDAVAPDSWHPLRLERGAGSVTLTHGAEVLLRYPGDLVSDVLVLSHEIPPHGAAALVSAVRPESVIVTGRPAWRRLTGADLEGRGDSPRTVRIDLAGGARIELPDRPPVRVLDQDFD